MSKALDLANLQEDGVIVTPTITGDTLFSDGAYDFDVASHDGTNGLTTKTTGLFKFKPRQSGSSTITYVVMVSAYEA